MDDNLSSSKVIITNSLGKLVVSDISVNVLNFLNTLNSNVQDQINSKQPFILGAISTVTNTNLDPSKVLISNIDGKLVTSDISVNELDTLRECYWKYSGSVG